MPALPPVVSPPPIGLGTWKIPKDRTADLVYEAIKVGYRHLDCACDYGNEPQVGDGIRRALDDGLCSRDELWVTSKLWNTFHKPEHVQPACDRTLADLGLDFVDLYHIHFPIALEYVDFETRYPPEWFHDPDAESPAMKPIDVPLTETYDAMERLHESGRIRNIGVCNLSTPILRELLSHARIRPVNLQIERHPYLTQQRLLRYCREQHISVTGFSPLGAPSYVSIGFADESDSVLKEPVVGQIAETLGCTPGQVVLAWGVQSGTSIVPKTEKPERLKENLAAADITLTDEQMQQIDALDRHRRFNDPGDFCERVFNCFYPIFD